MFTAPRNNVCRPAAAAAVPQWLRWALCATLAATASAPTSAAGNDACRAEYRACSEPCRAGERDAVRECRKACDDELRACHKGEREQGDPPKMLGAKTQRRVPTEVPPKMKPRFTIALEKLVAEHEGDAQRVAPLTHSGTERLKTPARMQAFSGLRCTYGSEARSVMFWQGERSLVPGLAPTRDTNNMSDGDTFIRIAAEQRMVDVGVDACPASWGAALEVVHGPKAWQQVAKNRTAYEAEIAADAQREERRRQREEQWQQQMAVIENREAAACAKTMPALTAKGALLTEEDIQLTCQVRVGLAVLEARRGYSGDVYVQIVNSRIITPLRELVGRALATSKRLHSSKPSWNEFDRWDRGVGGQAMDALIRLYDWASINNAAQERSKSLLQDIQDRSSNSSGYNPVGATPEVMAMYKQMLQSYQTLVQQAGMLDPAWHRQALLSMAQTYHPPGGSAPARPATPSTVTTFSTSRTVFMTPGQYMAASIGQDIGQALGAIIQLVKMAEEARAKAISAAHGLANHRHAFWTCYAERCGDSGMAFGSYMDAMARAEFHELILSPGFPMENRDSVNNAKGFLGCNPAWAALAAQVKAANAQKLDDADIVKRVMASKDYEAHLACRDQAEFIARYPRFTK